MAYMHYRVLSRVYGGVILLYVFFVLGSIYEGNKGAAPRRSDPWWTVEPFSNKCAILSALKTHQDSKQLFDTIPCSDHGRRFKKISNRMI